MKAKSYKLITQLKETFTDRPEDVPEIWIGNAEERRVIIKKFKNNGMGKEVEILKRLLHPNIIELIDYQQLSNETHILVFPYYKLGDLFQILTYHGPVITFTNIKFDECFCRSVMSQLSRAVSFIHRKGVVHRDLKLENVLVTSLDFRNHHIGIVVADFGLSKIITNENTQTPCGTFAYAAPELLLEKFYSQEVDIWSMGCLLFTLLVAYPPFYGDEKGSITDKIRDGFFEFQSPFWDSITNNARDLISKLLKVDPLQRLKAHEIESHSWFSDIVKKDYSDRPMWSPIPSVLKTPVDLETGNYFQKSGTPTIRKVFNAPIDKYASAHSYTGSQELINLKLTDSIFFRKRNEKK